jgi:hypothetical protein
MAGGHGGRRAGSGRKPGAVTVRNRAVADTSIADGGLSPLEFLLSIVRNPNEPAQRRLDAAKSAASFCHARLALEPVHSNSEPASPAAPATFNVISIPPGHTVEADGTIRPILFDVTPGS